MNKPEELEFFVNNKPVFTKEDDLTGRAIKELAGIPADYRLFRVQGDEPIPDDKVVEIHAKEHFRAIPNPTMG